MTYQELYKAVFEDNIRNENDTIVEHLARTILENHYNGITETSDAVYCAMELLPEMTGQDVDPTSDELSDIIYNVDNPTSIRVRRGLLKAMRANNLCDFIMQKYNDFRKEELARIIAEVDCAFYDHDYTHNKTDYKEAMDIAATELKDRLYC